VRVLLVAPNAGVSLSTGGGTNLLLKQARGLARRGHEVRLAGYHALSLPDLERLHGVPLDGLRSRIRVVSGGGDRAFRTRGRVPGKPSPYLLLFDPRVQRWFAGLTDRWTPDLAIFHDDVPRGATAWTGRVRTSLYVHFPLRGRSARLVPPLRSSRTTAEAAQDAVLRRARGRLILDDPVGAGIPVAANSTVTAEVVERLWGLRPRVWPTYVVPEPLDPEPRGRLVVAVGALHRGKGLERLAETFRRTAPAGAELRILGYARDPSVLRRLRRIAQGTGGGRVVVRPDAPRSAVDAALRGARVVATGAAFEPFGLSVLEGMAAGATALVHRSEFSGAWRDLVDGGRFGSGYSDDPDLADRLRDLLAPERAGPDPAARDRASAFDETRFDAGLAEALG